MEVEIIKKHDNSLLERTEVDFRVRHPGETTPTRDSIREALKEALKVSKETLVIDHMKGEFGKGETTGYAKVYKSAERAKYIEVEHVLVKNKLVEKKAAKKAEEKK
jgi:small subunit ribosomal protein S24e